MATKDCMEEELLKVNIISIAVSGLLMLLAGLLLYLLRDTVSRNLRFFLPIPPIAVAAYVFVFNLFRHYEGNLPSSTWDTLSEVFYGTLISTLVFFAFTLLIVVITYFLKELL